MTQLIHLSTAVPFWIYFIKMHTYFKDGSVDVASGGIVIKDAPVPDEDISTKQYMNNKGAPLSLKLTVSQIQDIQREWPVGETLDRLKLRKLLEKKLGEENLKEG